MQNALLLGMTNNPSVLRSEPILGQEYRDSIRVRQLEICFPLTVYTLDNKNEIKDERIRHISANFSDYRKMKKVMSENWGLVGFSLITLDYFFTPVRVLVFWLYVLYSLLYLSI